MIPWIRFPLPTLAEVNGQAEPLRPVDGEDVPWTSAQVDVRTLHSLLTRHFGAALRGLLMAGWKVPHVHLALGGVELEEVVAIDLRKQLIWNEDDGAWHVDGSIGDSALPWPGPGTALIVDLEPLTNPFGDSIGIALPSSSVGEPWYLVEDSEKTRLVVWSSERIESQNRLPRVLSAAIAELERDLQSLLCDRLMLGDEVTPQDSGLLWLFDPQYWPAATSEVVGDPLSVMGEVGLAANAALGSTEAEAREFISEQMSGDGRLRRLLRSVDGVKARHSERRFFAALQQLAVDEYAIPIELQRQLPRLPWLEVLLHLATYDLLPLLDLEREVPDEEDGDWLEPLEEQINADGTEITITVLGVDKVVLRRVQVLTRVVDEGDASVEVEIPLRDLCCWEYVAAHDGGLPRLVVVAGPGVEIVAPADYDDPNTEFAWSLDIFRVQDPGQVPPRGDRLHEETLLQSYSIGQLRELEEADAMPEPAVLVKPVRDGVRLLFPAVAGSTSDHREAIYITLGDVRSGHQRFTFELVPLDATLADSTFYFGLLIAATEGVRVSCYELTGLNWSWGLLGPNVYTYKFEPLQFEVPFADVRLPGESYGINENDLWTHINPPIRDSPVPNPMLPTASGYVEGFEPSTKWALAQSSQTAFKLFVDVGIGLIPLVGDFVDIGDLLLALTTGKDKWGDEVTGWDLLILTVSVAPFVSSAYLKGLRTTIGGQIPSLVSNATGDFLESIWRGSDEVRRASKRVDRRMIEQNAAKQAFQRMMQQWAEAAGRTAAGQVLDLADISTLGGLGFPIPQLQYLLVKARALTGEPSMTTEDFVRWAAGPDGDVWARFALEALLGPSWETATLGVRGVQRQASRAWWSFAQDLAPIAVKNANELVSWFAVDGNLLQAVQKVVPDPDEALEMSLYVTKLLRQAGGLADDAPLSSLTASGLKNLIKSRSHDPQNLVYELVIGLRMADDELLRTKAIIEAADDDLATQLGRNLADLDDSYVTLAKLLDVHGVYDMFADMLSRSTKEWGFRGELKLIGLALAVTKDPKRIMAQIKLPIAKGQNAGKLGKGPDVGVITDEGVELWQVKAESSARRVVYSLRSQLLRDGPRLTAEALARNAADPTWRLPDPNDATNELPVLSVMRAFADDAWLLINGNEFEPEAFAAMSEDLTEVMTHLHGSPFEVLVGRL